MKKRLLTFVITVLLLIGVTAVSAETATDAVKSVAGRVTINAETEAEAGTPVLIIILPQKIENEIDVTVSKVNDIVDKSDFTTLNAVYIKTVKAGENGLVSHTCQLSETAGTSRYHVVLNFLGSDTGSISIGEFEHVGVNDRNEFVRKMNQANADICEAIILEDINGVDTNNDGDTDDFEDTPPKNILYKSFVDTGYYESLTDKSSFHRLLYVLKGQTDFTFHTLVEAFNETVAWIQLQNETDTLNVLKRYNGEGADKYWQLSLDETSVFAELSITEQEKLLGKIKDGKYTTNTSLEKAFESFLVLAKFRALSTREEIEEFISENGDYSPYFSNVRSILAVAGLDAYEISQVYNGVMSEANSCETMEDIEKLFKDSIPEKVIKDTGGSSMGSGGNSSIKVSTPNVTPSSNELPFVDIPDTHWAIDYIKRLYNANVINGVSSNSFDAESKVQRQDFVKILIGALQISVSDRSSVFKDIPDGAYYTPYVMAAYEMGLVSGVGDSKFNIGCSISREDAAVLIDRVLKKHNISVQKAENIFADECLAADYSKESIANVASAEIFTGDENGNFNPKASLTRAEACAILCRLADAVKEE